MSKKFICVDYKTPIGKCVDLMLSNNLKDIFINDKAKMLEGVLTLADISIIKQEGKYEDCIPVAKVMTSRLVTDSPDVSLVCCRNRMIKEKIGVLPLVEKEKIVGVIRSQHIRDNFYMEIEELNVKLQNIINSIHEAICVVDAKGIVIIWNRNAEKLYDIPLKSIIGKNISEFFPDAAIENVLKNKKKIENIYHSPRKDTYIVISVLPIYIDGKFVGVVSTDRDVTEVRNLSKKLENTKSKLNFLEDELKRVSGSFGKIIGKSAKIIKKIDIARQVAKSDASIIITGESGTGKEVFARAIHEHSARKGLFVPVNCSAIPYELFESELFGYDPGAFTGASRKGKMGIFELANNGTIFLDEIGDMPMHMQAKILRVLQEKEIMRVGGEKKIKVNARVISATHKNLKEMVVSEEFREDLYYRLNVVEIELPPLRERKEDIVLLINHFLKELCEKNSLKIPQIDNDVMNILQNYEWHGNIRELKNAVEHLLVLSRENKIILELVPPYILKNVKQEEKNQIYPLDLGAAIAKIEVDTIKKALNISNGNKAKAAKILNIPRSTLYYKIDTYKIECQ